MKPIDELLPTDFEVSPVWEFVNDDARGETVVRPVKKTPVDTLDGRVVGTQVSLANGDKIWALIGNVDPVGPRLNSHLLTLSVFRDEAWFTLARYHDFGREGRDPESLAKLLRLPLSDVFPISYDIRSIMSGERPALFGCIEQEPDERLTRSQLIALIRSSPK